MDDLERRTFEEPLELRTEEGKPSRLVGYAAKFDVESKNLGGFREIIRKGAFDRTLKEGPEVVARVNHRSEMLLGKKSSGTLRLSVDEVGLRYEVDLPDTSVGRDVAEYVRRGDIRESSFAFRTPKGGDKWTARSSEGTPLREVSDVDLVDVAPVIDPAAYPSTQVALRTLEEANRQTELEELGVPNEINEARLRLF
jgi:HK97 family phage prohead protease